MYEKAWAYAAEQMETHGRRLSARRTREKYGIAFSASSATRAAASGGVPPGKRGAKLIIPDDVERKLEDLCLLLRELNLPVYRFMILNYVNQLVEGTEIAERLKDKEVKRGWYYRWPRVGATRPPMRMVMGLTVMKVMKTTCKSIPTVLSDV